MPAYWRRRVDIFCHSSPWLARRAEPSALCVSAGVAVLYSSLLGKTVWRWGQPRSGNIPMPRAPLHALIWSTDQTLYELYSRGQLTHRFRPDDDSWRTWLGAHTAFVFQGHSGRINLHNEQRTRTRRYWYAYHAADQRAKRYLGKTATLTFERLEQVAGELSGAHLPAPDASHAPSPA